MTQTRIGSFIESCVNVAIGLTISMTANALVLPAFGFDITLSQNAAIAVIFTIISIVRSYFVRRYFNQRIKRAAERAAKSIR